MEQISVPKDSLTPFVPLFFALVLLKVRSNRRRDTYNLYPSPLFFSDRIIKCTRDIEDSPKAELQVRIATNKVITCRQRELRFVGLLLTPDLPISQGLQS